MAEILDDNMMLCEDCAFIAANDDASVLTEKREAEVRRSIHALDGHLCAGNSEEDEEFSWRPCHCCLSQLGGSRMHFVLMS